KMHWVLETRRMGQGSSRRGEFWNGACGGGGRPGSDDREGSPAHRRGVVGVPGGRARDRVTSGGLLHVCNILPEGGVRSRGSMVSARGCHPLIAPASTPARKYFWMNG